MEKGWGEATRDCQATGNWREPCVKGHPLSRGPYGRHAPSKEALIPGFAFKQILDLVW